MTQQILLPYVLALILNDKNEVLLGHRSNTEWFPNTYGLIGGKIDEKESAIQAMKREISEEVGINVSDKDINFEHVIHFLGDEGAPCVAFFYSIKKWTGDIRNAEKNRHDHLKWFSLDELPENIIPRHKKALEFIKKRMTYSEDNWDKVIKK